jgi:GntR family transcriptional repressor for pyruvate dehydrogenase complex
MATRILDGQLRVGDRLPTERNLAAQMLISRPTLREAIHVLVDAGVVRVQRGRGGGIVVASEYVPRQVLEHHTRLRVSEVTGVLEARRLLEPPIARLAAIRATQDDLQRLADILDRHKEFVASRRMPQNKDHYLQLDRRFHLGIARASRNTTAVLLMESLFTRLEIAFDMAMHVPALPDWCVDLHERTLAAIASGKPDEVDAIMDEHLGLTEGVWEQETGFSVHETILPRSTSPR